MRGLEPTSFRPEKPSLFPQLTSYRQPGYPRNIQEILGYVTENVNSNRNQLNYGEEQYYPQNPYNNQAPSTINNNYHHSQTNYPATVPTDPFNTYKPQDPSDVNLLATGNVRFAPPLWSNFMKTHPKLHAQMSRHNLNVTKPMSLVLNVFPIGNEFRIFAQPYRPSSNVFRNEQFEEFKSRSVSAKKMILHVNFYDMDLET